MADASSSSSHAACRLDLQIDGYTTTAAIAGEIDLDTAPDLEAKVHSAVERPGVEALVLDLRELTFMDSTGLRFLMSIKDHAQLHEYRLSILRPPATVYRVITITGLDRFLPLVGDPTPPTTP